MDEINDGSSTSTTRPRAVGISTDVSSATSVQSMIARVKEEWGEDVKCKAAIFNASGAFVRKPFLEITEGEFEGSWGGSVYVCLCTWVKITRLMRLFDV